MDRNRFPEQHHAEIVVMMRLARQIRILVVVVVPAIMPRLSMAAPPIAAVLQHDMAARQHPGDEHQRGE